MIFWFPALVTFLVFMGVYFPDTAFVWFSMAVGNFMIYMLVLEDEKYRRFKKLIDEQEKRCKCD